MCFHLSRPAGEVDARSAAGEGEAKRCAAVGDAVVRLPSPCPLPQAGEGKAGSRKQERGKQDPASRRCLHLSRPAGEVDARSAAGEGEAKRCACRERRTSSAPHPALPRKGEGKAGSGKRERGNQGPASWRVGGVYPKNGESWPPFNPSTTQHAPCPRDRPSHGTCRRCRTAWRSCRSHRARSRHHRRRVWVRHP